MQKLNLGKFESSLTCSMLYGELANETLYISFSLDPQNESTLYWIKLYKNMLQ